MRWQFPQPVRITQAVCCYCFLYFATTGFYQKTKYPIPVVDVATQAVTEEELPKVFEVIDKNPGLLALILKGHGIVTMDKTAVKAGQTAELIEETSMINWEQKKFEMLK